MVEKITDQELQHKLDLGGNIRDGEWVLPIPNLTYGDYKFIIDYDSDYTNHLSYQYGGYIVVGKTPIMRANPIIASYETEATLESQITQTEKYNTSFTFNLACIDPNSVNQSVGIEHLPFSIRFLKGSFKDYNAEGMESTLNNDKNLAATIPNFSNYVTYGTNDVNSKNKLIPKTSYGTMEDTLKVSMLFNDNEEITQYNTIFFVCEGTINRGTDNYVPKVIAVPLIIGTRSVYLVIKGLRDDSYDSTDVYSNGVRGGGSLAIAVETTEAFAHNGHLAKVGYEDYLTNDSKKVHIGYFTFQRQYQDGTWHDVPSSEVSTKDSNTYIDENGRIYQTGNMTGTINFVWNNAHSLMYIGSENVRLYYHGVVGQTRNQISSEYLIEMKPENKSDNPLKLDITINNGTVDELSYIAQCAQTLVAEIDTAAGFNSKINGVLRVVISEKED